MSAPQTNLDKQKKRHIGPLLGIAAALAFVGLLILYWYPQGAETAVTPDPTNTTAAGTATPATPTDGSTDGTAINVTPVTPPTP